MHKRRVVSSCFSSPRILIFNFPWDSFGCKIFNSNGRKKHDNFLIKEVRRIDPFFTVSFTLFQFHLIARICRHSLKPLLFIPCFQVCWKKEVKRRFFLIFPYSNFCSFSDGKVFAILLLCETKQHNCRIRNIFFMYVKGNLRSKISYKISIYFKSVIIANTSDSIKLL